jgi:hypothetical protein
MLVVMIRLDPYIERGIATWYSRRDEIMETIDEISKYPKFYI